MTSKIKRICLVIPSFQAGGMERVMSELAFYFSNKSILEIHLILYGMQREIFYSIPDNIVLHKPAFEFKNSMRIYYTIRTLFFLRRTIKKINPDSILSFGEYWNNFVLLSVLGQNQKVFVSDRCQPDKSLGRFHDFLRRKLYVKAEGLIVQTEKAREIYQKKISHNNIEVIGNPIRNINLNGKRYKKEKNVLMVGRLIETKHQDELIKMFAKVSPEDWKLIIVGYDHLKQKHMERLKELAIDLKVADRVLFLGKQEQIEKIYIESSVFAFTSSSEGFPNAIGEAMSAGLPVVAFNCIAGPSEMVEDNYNGYLVPLFDYKLFEERLKILMESENLRDRLGKNARMDIQKFFIDHIGEKFLNFIIDRNN